MVKKIKKTNVNTGKNYQLNKFIPIGLLLFLFDTINSELKKMETVYYFIHLYY